MKNYVHDFLRLVREMSFGLLITVFLFAFAEAEIHATLLPDSTNHREFVENSLAYLHSGVPRIQILDRLLRVAKSKGTKRSIQEGAVHAIFHIAEADAEIREYLLRILTAEDKEGSGAQWEAANLIVYVADANCRQALFECYLRDPHHPRALSIFKALSDLGDEGFVKGLEGVVADPSVDVARARFYESQIRRIALQQSVDGLLEYLRSGAEEGPYQGWAVYRAVRQGAQIDQIRIAVMDYLELAKRNGIGKGGRIESVVKAGVGCGVFREADYETMETLGIQLDRILDLDPPFNAVWPPWATKVSEKATEFSRIGVSVPGSR